jgi:hypothetical protein
MQSIPVPHALLGRFRRVCYHPARVSDCLTTSDLATYRTRMISEIPLAHPLIGAMSKTQPTRPHASHQQDFRQDHPAHPPRSHIRPAPPSTTSCQAGTSLPLKHRRHPDASRYMSSAGRPRRSDRCTNRVRLGRELMAIHTAMGKATAMDMATGLEGQSAR